jgi:hypothetical protein
MQRELLISVTTLLTLLLVGTLQLTVPPSIKPGTPEANRYRFMIMYWTPLAVFVQNIGFPVSRTPRSQALPLKNANVCRQTCYEVPLP